MAEVAKVQNVDRLVQKLKARYAHMDDPNPAVIVGYTANYALYVHENVEMKWKGLPRGGGLSVKDGIVLVSKRMLQTGQGSFGGHKGFYWDPQGRGQAKFLEQPARELQPEFKRIITEAMVRGAKLGKALMLAGLRLLRESQRLVPVDTGNLKGSAFIIEEHRR